MNVLGKVDTFEAKFMNRIEAKTLEGRWKTLQTWMPFDSTATAALIEPSVRFIIRIDILTLY
jgi:hypothetical protein